MSMTGVLGAARLQTLHLPMLAGLCSRVRTSHPRTARMARPDVFSDIKTGFGQSQNIFGDAQSDSVTCTEVSCFCFPSTVQVWQACERELAAVEGLGCDLLDNPNLLLV
jgi:hypothetical protein